MFSYLNQTFCRELRGQVCNLETHIYYMYTYFVGVKCCCHFVWLLSWAKKTMAHKNAGCNITVDIIVGGWNPAPHWYAIAINIPWFGRLTHHVICFRGFCPSTKGLIGRTRDICAAIPFKINRSIDNQSWLSHSAVLDPEIKSSNLTFFLLNMWSQKV